MVGAIKVGDVVMLKSGGPKMTVSQIEMVEGAQMFAFCHWFVEGQKVGRPFALATLAKVPDQAGRRPDK